MKQITSNASETPNSSGDFWGREEWLRNIQAKIPSLGIWFKINIFKIASVFLFFISLVEFTDFWKCLINKYWVEPVMSKIGSSSALFIFFVSLVLVVLYVFLSVLFEKKYWKNRFWLILFAVVIYTLSFFSGLWYYKESYGIAYTHVVYLLLLLDPILIYKSYLRSKRLKTRSDKYAGLLYDLPIDEQSNNESFKRRKYAQSVADELVKSFKSEGSFAIGIIGEWGAGKTSFSDMIQCRIKELDRKNSDRVEVIINFKPWFNKTSNEIIESFFSQYLRQVSVYIPSLSSKIPKYIQVLVESNDNKWVKLFQKIFFISADTDAQKLYEDIWNQLRDRDVRVMVFIDDLDRLDANEVLEVLRLIRNTANFPNTIFIATYDKEYIVGALGDSHIPKPEQYLQKIFNMEIALPKYEDRVICEELEFCMIEVFSKYSTSDYFRKVAIDISFLKIDEDHGSLPFLIPKVLPTIRDVKRYVNALKVNTILFRQEMNEEVDLYEFCLLELIRYRAPEIYNLLRDDPLRLLDLNSQHHFIYRFRYSKEDDNLTPFIKFLNKKNEGIENLLKNLLKQLFLDEKDVLSNSIKHVNGYFKYFAYRLDGKSIPISEFIDVIVMDKPILNIEKWFRTKNNREIEDKLDYCFKAVKKGTLSSDIVYNYIKKLLDGCKPNALQDRVLMSVNRHLRDTTFQTWAEYIAFVDLWAFCLRMNAGLKANDPLYDFLSVVLYGKYLQRKSPEVIFPNSSSEILNIFQNSPYMIELGRSLVGFVGNRFDEESSMLSLVEIWGIVFGYLQKQMDLDVPVDTELLVLFDNCVRIQELLNNDYDAIVPSRAYVDKDPEGYIENFVEIEVLNAIDNWKQVKPEKNWIKLFLNDENFESFIFDDRKNLIKGVQRVRNFWKLLKHFKVRIEFKINVNVEAKLENDFADEIMMLESLLGIQRKIEDLGDAYNQIESGQNPKLVQEIEELKKVIEESDLDITIKDKIKREFSFLD